MNDGSTSSATEGSLAAGTLLGEFEVVELLGRGSFGEVYRAHQARWKRDVAVKVILAGANKHIPDIGQRFVREIDVIRRLQHPNVVHLHDFGQSPEGHLWMAMELVVGPTLGAVLALETKLAPPRARSICLQILSGLVEAHQASIVHRDIKPANIMLTRKGAHREWVKILDFGVGKVINEKGSRVQDLTREGLGGFGTPRYMSPEQIQIDEIGPYTDVYSTGLIFYEMLVGEPAIHGLTSYDMLIQHLQQGVVLPSWLDPTALGAVLRKATERRWEDRYSSAMEFHEALEALNESELLGCAPPPEEDAEDQTIRVSIDSLAKRLDPAQSAALEETHTATGRRRPIRDTLQSYQAPEMAEQHRTNALDVAIPSTTGPTPRTWPILLLGVVVVFVSLGLLLTLGLQRFHEVEPQQAQAPASQGAESGAQVLREAVSAPVSAPAELSPKQHELMTELRGWVDRQLPPAPASKPHLLRAVDLIEVLIHSLLDALFVRSQPPAPTAPP